MTLAAACGRSSGEANANDRQGFLWGDYLEWSVSNPSFKGNPYDVIAEVLFTHIESHEVRRTDMFYAGKNTWKFRFTGTREGKWRFHTSSFDSDLDDISGSIVISENPEPRSGFVTGRGSKWTRSADEKRLTFVPQLVMYSDPHLFFKNDEKIKEDIDLFINEHGFNGFHVGVYCRWFDLYGTVLANNRPKCSRSRENPDRRTFEALEALITKTYSAGGIVHLWAWGDDMRRHTPTFLDGGINGRVDKRLQRYIAARLGPIPGWTMGYGYDLWEWVNMDQLNEWHQFMHSKMFWPHMLGARASKNKLDQLSELMDFSSYEQHRPDYATYLQTINARPMKPSFSADRFRISSVTGEGESKHYSWNDVRRGLWRSAMAGGVANIWGNLITLKEEGSAAFDNYASIKTYSMVFNHHYYEDFVVCEHHTDALCLYSKNSHQYIYYQEDTINVSLDFDDIGDWNGVAIDTLKPYKEIEIERSVLDAAVWNAPYRSDWAILTNFD